LIIILVLIIFWPKDNKTNVTTSPQVVTNKVYVVKLSGYTFEMPNDAEYTIGDGYVTLSNRQGTWTARGMIMETSYDVVCQQENLSKIAQNLVNKGYINDQFSKNTETGREYLMIRFHKDNDQKIIAMTKLDEKHVMVWEIATKYDVKTEESDSTTSANNVEKHNRRN